jgi:glycerol-3-phosphate cytidylyltransferase
LKCVDLAIPEESWDQKRKDILKFDVSVFGMGHDWTGKFDTLSDLCEVKYLTRTENISSTQIRKILSPVDSSHLNDLKKALEIISTIVERLD